MTSWPFYDDEQISDVVEVLRSGQVNAWTGPYVGNFEAAYARYLGRRHAIALANGSLALDLALKVLKVKPDDEVIVTPRSFAASATCVALAGGTPVFADVDLDSQNLTAATIEPNITPRTKGIIVVHLAGWPCDMGPISTLARRHGLWVIEDCAQAHGALYHNRPVGGFGDIAIFSFCQDKIITTGGEGGLLALDDEAMWKEAWSYKDHGKSHEAVFERRHPHGFRWLHEGFGTNYRMTSIQATLGLRQLQRLDSWHAARARNARILIDEFRKHAALRTPEPPPGTVHAWYRLYAFVETERLRQGWSRDRILDAVTSLGIPCFTGSCPEIYLEKAFINNGLGPSQRLPNARRLGETSLAFLVDPSRTEAELQETAQNVGAILTEATI